VIPVPGVIPSILAGIKIPAGMTMAKYRRESFIPAGIKKPALSTTAKPRWDSLHTGGNQDTGGNHNGKPPARIRTPAGIITAKPRRDSLHTGGNQDTGGNHNGKYRRESTFKTPVGITIANTGGNHNGPAGLDAIPTGMPAESRRFYVHRDWTL
jgi:hypothetical protein